MKYETLLFLGLLGSRWANAFQCNKDDRLKKYRLAQGNGGGYVYGSVERDTPPSTTEEKWWVNVCAENDKNDLPSECDRNDVLCGLTYVTVPGRDTLMTQEIEFPHSLSGPVEEVDGKLRLSLRGTKWGSESFDAQLEFECDDNMKTDEMVSSTWQDKQIRINIKGPSGCLIKNEDGNRDKDRRPHLKDPNERKKGTSWFTWLLLYALLFTLIYLLVTAYVNTRGGSFQDFREEFIDRSTQLITSLPAFAKEVAARIFGSGSSQRGGYSAV
ncbi:hypothetical protein HG536_0A01970 [Torulaspora globosa]|uniref:Autophagy-related protein 27 n=1 Tax=Torulaspora globosa TaxID=48254 RepID=A0A7G3ZA44_9SACH|nr:uncharacterized protein HG536_0A01970 [Torulaspora globosa]QLL30380.1 hypothetical protein HG536_0A01970 [Torulaspora globosa]